jgi:hypothetical protein
MARYYQNLDLLPNRSMLPLTLKFLCINRNLIRRAEAQRKGLL